MKPILLLLLTFVFAPCRAQVRVFSGSIAKYPIQLATFSYPDGDTRAIYAYDAYDTPLIVNGRLNNDTLVLMEYNEMGEVAARLEFLEFTSTTREVKGKWISRNKENVFEITLTKLIEFDSYDETSFAKQELLQPASTQDHYFKLLISKEKGMEVEVTGVRIYEKKTDKLLQEIDLECYFWGLENISVGDYNFDGMEDFSVFEATYAGPNTTSIYVLRDPQSGEYFVSEIAGISLEFDPETRRIYEHNQCCAGRRHMNSVYRVVNNKMVLVERTCLEYDDETDEFVETECD